MPEPIALFDRNNYFWGDRKPEESSLIALEQKGDQVKSKIIKWEELIKDLKENYSSRKRLDEDLKKLQERFKKLVGAKFYRPTIQIGFLGQSNAGKSRWLNELCGNPNLAKLGTTATPTSSAIVRYTSSTNGDRCFSVTSFLEAELAQKNKILIETLCSDLNVLPIPKEDSDAVGYIRTRLPSGSKDRNSLLDEKNLSLAWEFVEKFKEGSLRPFGKKSLNTIDEFQQYVNHSDSSVGNSNSVATEALCTRYGIAPVLPGDFPKILEIVDVPGVGAGLLDDFMVEKYFHEIDAWFFMYKIDLTKSTEITKVATKSKETWYHSGEKNGYSLKKRFSGAIAKFAKWDPQLIGVAANWSKLKDECGGNFFFLEAEPGKITDPDVGKVDADDFSNFFHQTCGTVLPLLGNKSEGTKKDAHDKIFSRFEKEYRLLAEDGGKSAFRDFFLLKWPVMVADEIATKGMYDLDLLLRDLEDLKEELEAAKELTIDQRLAIINGVVAIQDAKRSLTTGENDVLNKAISEIREQCKSVIEKGARAFDQNLHEVDNVVKFLRNVSIQCGSIILKGLITDVIKLVYAQVGNEFKFGNFKVRINIKSSDETTLQQMWKETIPLKGDLDQLQGKINKNEVTYQQLEALLDDDFKRIIFDHTGLDELLHGLQKKEVCLLNPWVKELLILDYSSNYPRLRRLVEDCVDNTLIDAVQITKGYVLDALNENLVLLQALEKKIA